MPWRLNSPKRRGIKEIRPMMTQEPPSLPFTPTAVAVVETPSLALVPQEAVVETWRGKKFRVPGDKFNAWTKDLPDEQCDALRWFFGYCRSRDLGEAAMSEVLLRDPEKPSKGCYDANSVGQLMSGKRFADGVNLEPMVRSILALRQKVESQSRVGEAGFIVTRMSEVLFRRFDVARARRKILPVFGDSQIGKTETAIEYTRLNNHGNTILMETPTGGGLLMFLEKLAERIGIPSQLRLADLRRRICGYFDHHHLLIVDEAHRCLRTRSGIQTLDFLRELYNERGCGIVIMMTDEGRDLFRSGPHAKALEQLWRRRIQPIQLPKVLPKDDLDKFAAAHGLPPADAREVEIEITDFDELGQERKRKIKRVPVEIERDVNATDGLGVWLTILGEAKDLSKRKGKTITWGAVIKAYLINKADAEVLE